VLNLKKTLFNVISSRHHRREPVAVLYFRNAVAQKVGVKKAAKHFVFTPTPRKAICASWRTRKKFQLRDPGECRRALLGSLTGGPALGRLHRRRYLKLLAGAQAMAQRCAVSHSKKIGRSLCGLQYLYYAKGVRCRC